MSIVNISDTTEFNDKVLKADKPVLVDFWAPWCGPCKMVGPEVEAVEASVAGKVLVAKVNVDDHSELAEKYGVSGVPTLLVLKQGQEVSRMVGFRPRDVISAELNKVM